MATNNYAPLNRNNTWDQLQKRAIKKAFQAAETAAAAGDHTYKTTCRSLNSQILDPRLSAGEAHGIKRLLDGIADAIVAYATPYSASTVDVNGTDESYNDAAATFITNGFAVGDTIKVTGFTTGANNVTAGVITALTETKMTVGGSNLTTEAAGDAVVITKTTPSTYDVVQHITGFEMSSSKKRVIKALAENTVAQIV